jgi:hypothetical protein
MRFRQLTDSKTIPQTGYKWRENDLRGKFRKEKSLRHFYPELPPSNFGAPRVTNDVKIEIVAPRGPQQYPEDPRRVPNSIWLGNPGKFTKWAVLGVVIFRTSRSFLFVGSGSRLSSRIRARDPGPIDFCR